MNDWKKTDRYKDYTVCENPRPFSEMFKDKDFSRVQVHSNQVVEPINDIVGFCGAFAWEDNVIRSLDGDSYNKDMLVLGYEIDDDCLEIMVGSDW